MVEKYCDIHYRDYLLEIEQNEFVPGKFHYCGRSQDKVSFFAGPYSYVHHPINRFTALVDEILGEREKEEEILFCTIIYNGYELEIWLKEDLSYYAHIAKFDFASWGTWSNEELVEVIEAFRKKVDSGTGENLIQLIDYYKDIQIIVRKEKDKDWFTAIYSVNGQEYYSGNSDIDKIIKYFRSNVDKLMEKNMKELTYQEVYDEWGRSRYKSVFYKDKQLSIILVPKEEVVTLPLPYKSPYRKPFYVGTFKYTPRGEFCKRTSFESIHYDKVVSRFQRFVDEYCTDWRDCCVYGSKTISYKGYNLTFKKEYEVENYFGTCEIHKNSTFKCISNSIKEIEGKFKARIDRMIYEKERVQRKMLTPKQEKIQELEQLLAKISTQLEELKKEKDTLTYKGVVLECEQGKDDTWVFVGKIRNAPENMDIRDICGDSLEEIQRDFEEYIDWLEVQYILYRKLTGKEE